MMTFGFILLIIASIALASAFGLMILDLFFRISIGEGVVVGAAIVAIVTIIPAVTLIFMAENQRWDTNNCIRIHEDDHIYYEGVEYEVDYVHRSDSFVACPT